MRLADVFKPAGDRRYTRRDYHPADHVSVRCGSIFFYRFCVGSTPNELQTFEEQAHAWIEWWHSDHSAPEPTRPNSGGRPLTAAA